VTASALFRAYLYLASFGGVVALAIGLVALLNWGIAAIGGTPLVYGGPTDPGRPIAFTLDLERRRSEDLARGVIFTAFGGLFWLAHWLARNRLALGDQGALQRSYLFLGTAVFGIATLVFLPNGIYQAIAGSLIVSPGSFRQGVGGSLTPGIVSLILWLLYFRLAAGATRGFDRRWAFRGGPSAPPAEPSAVGAPIGPGPSSRSAGAAAVPPLEGGR